ncbi:MULTISPECIES: putative quinol monooxygenase [Nocardioides]|uniref:Quinol monooxygenase n=1 Tax=Nocardioides vastitatis TaxID=2568655 RepID=A0ABW0ZF79_9ACTN|nr:antibiotic biosynthesis monooxygenase [Nocardioides sp.]THJ05312.1 antibiotic biosynthesis monooxygenase [Nocardioides sp.]
MIVVAGHLLLDPDARNDYLAGCREVVEQARAADGCLDFAISADLVDRRRINVLERWSSAAALEAFRGAGTSDDQASVVRRLSVAEYDVAAERRLG